LHRPETNGGPLPDSGFIRRIFAGISPRYDLLNRLLSLGVDRGWRRRAVSALTAGPPDPGIPGREARVLDICCGTGDLSLDLAKAGLEVTGADFCHEMLVIGRSKAAARGSGESRGRVRLAEADALRLPFRDGAFSGATVAFGVRNLQDLDAGLAEMRRVIGAGGRLAVLEFGRPQGAIVGPLYLLYLNVVVPIVGRLLSGSREAYGWLSSSIQAFPDQAAFPARLERAGFTEVRVESLTFGIAALYVGTAPARPVAEGPEPADGDRTAAGSVTTPSGSASPPSGRGAGSPPGRR